MEINNNKKDVENSDSGNDLNCQESLLTPKTADLPPAIVENNNQDIVDTRHEKVDSKKSREIPFVTVGRIVKLAYPIFSHVFDFVSDIRLTIDYFANQKTGHGSFTLAFTILQAITAAWVSSLMHRPKLMRDESVEDEKETSKGNWFARTVQRIAQCITALLFHMAMPMCRMHNLYYAWELRRAQEKGNEIRQTLYYHRKMLEENRDLAVHQVMGCFLQRAPQLILQLYILLGTQDIPINAPMWAKIVSGIITLFDLGSAMRNYHCAVRLAQNDKTQISEIGGVFLLFWHLCTIAARIFVIGVAANRWFLYTLLACVINWIGWTAWIHAKENGVYILGRSKGDSFDESQTATKRLRNWILSAVVAVVYMFTYVNVGDGRTFVKNFVYYALCLLQKGTVVVFWSIFCNMTVELVWLSQYLLISSVVLFFIGIAAMVTYYMFFHPTLPRGCCVGRCSTCVEDGFLPK